MIELKNISKKYDDKKVLRNFSASFVPNAINIVSGPSGCGKTTLFNIISGIDTDYGGTVSGVPEKIAYLFQEDRLLPYYTVLDNVLFTMPEEIDKEKSIDAAMENLGKLNLSEEKDSFPHELSGGMSRRAALARALSYPCEALLLDEPFNGLNIELKRTVVGAIEESLLSNGKTVILITHDLSPFDKENGINLIEMEKHQDPA